MVKLLIYLTLIICYVALCGHNGLGNYLPIHTQGCLDTFRAYRILLEKEIQQ